MPRPDVIEALRELDPGQRALLDLSLNRKLSDTMISGLLENVDEAGVERMRSEALAALAQAAGIEGPDAPGEVERRLRSASDEQWLGDGEADGSATDPTDSDSRAAGSETAAPAVEQKPSAPSRPPARPARPAAAPGPRDGDSRSSRGTWIASLLVLALVGAIALAVALSGGDESSEPAGSAGPSTPASPSEPGGPSEPGDPAAPGDPSAPGGPSEPESPPAPDPAPDEDPPVQDDPPPPAEPAAEPVALEPLAGLTPDGAGATITPAADGEGLTLRLSGLPGGYYRLWVYDSLIESEPVAGRAGAGALRFDLPASSADFESLDVSLEDGPTDRIHSGRSVFRIALSDLPG